MWRLSAKWGAAAGASRMAVLPSGLFQSSEFLLPDICAGDSLVSFWPKAQMFGLGLCLSRYCLPNMLSFYLQGTGLQKSHHLQRSRPCSAPTRFRLGRLRQPHAGLAWEPALKMLRSGPFSGCSRPERDGLRVVVK